jgi:hypothetical protein
MTNSTRKNSKPASKPAKASKPAPKPVTIPARTVIGVDLGTLNSQAKAVDAVSQYGAATVEAQVHRAIAAYVAAAQGATVADLIAAGSYRSAGKVSQSTVLGEALVKAKAPTMAMARDLMSAQANNARKADVLAVKTATGAARLHKAAKAAKAAGAAKRDGKPATPKTVKTYATPADAIAGVLAALDMAWAAGATTDDVVAAIIGHDAEHAATVPVKVAS